MKNSLFKNKQKRQRNDATHFTCRLDFGGIFNLLMIIGILLGLMFVLVWVLGTTGVLKGDPDELPGFLWLGLYTALLPAVIYLLISVRSLKVNGKTLVNTSFTGFRKTFSVNDVASVRVMKKQIVTFFEPKYRILSHTGRRICSVSGNFSNDEKLLPYFKKHRIPVEEIPAKPIKKSYFFISLHHTMAIISFGISLWLAGAFFVMYVRENGFSSDAVMRSLLLFFSGFLTLELVFLVFLSPHLLKGLLLLRKQERVLHFRFNDEMRAHGVTRGIYNDREWFVMEQGMMIYRKDFFAEKRDAVTLENAMRKVDSKRSIYTLELRTCTGEVLKVRGDNYQLRKLIRWLTNPSGYVSREEDDKLLEEIE